MITYTKIKEITIPTKGIGRYINIQCNAFQLGTNVVTFNWKILENIDFNSTPLLEGRELLNGEEVMADNDLESWGSDDNVAIDFVLNKIGVIKY